MNEIQKIIDDTISMIDEYAAKMETIREQERIKQKRLNMIIAGVTTLLMLAAIIYSWMK